MNDPVGLKFLFGSNWFSYVSERHAAEETIIQFANKQLPEVYKDPKHKWAVRTSSLAAIHIEEIPPEQKALLNAQQKQVYPPSVFGPNLSGLN